MRKTRFAVASTDGVNVDEHFGKAASFLIYEAGPLPELVEKRSVIPLSVDDPGHAFDPDRFGRISDSIKDCARVYVVKIGEIPAAKLAALGITPVAYSGPIAEIAI